MERLPAGASTSSREAHAREPLAGARLPAAQAPPHGGDGEVLADGQVAEDLHGLERAADAAARDLVGGEPVDALAVVEDGALVGPQEPGHQIEDRALAGAVGADEAHHGAGRDLERAGADGAEAAEPLAEAGEGELRRRYFFSHAYGGTGTYLPPAAAATDSG